LAAASDGLFIFEAYTFPDWMILFEKALDIYPFPQPASGIVCPGWIFSAFTIRSMSRRPSENSLP
jgi:hypothetical protein